MPRAAKPRKRSKSPSKLNRSGTAKNPSDGKHSKKHKRSVSSKEKANPPLTLHHGLPRTERAATKLKAASSGQAAKRPSIRHDKNDRANHSSLKGKATNPASLEVDHVKSSHTTSETSSRRSQRSSVASGSSHSRRLSSMNNNKNAWRTFKDKMHDHADPHPIVRRKPLGKDNNHCPSSIPLITDLSPCNSMETDVNGQDGRPSSEGGQGIPYSFPRDRFPPLRSPDIEEIRASFNKFRLPTRSVWDLQSELKRIGESCEEALDHDGEILRMAREAGVELTGPWLTATKDDKGALLGAGNFLLEDLCARDLISIFSYCAAPSLAELSRTCKRFHVLCGSSQVWFGRTDLHSAARKKSVPKNLKKELLNHPKQVEDDEEEVVKWRAMYKDLEQRMDERVVEEHARKLPESVQGLLGKQNLETMAYAQGRGLNLAPRKRFFDLCSKRNLNTTEHECKDNENLPNPDADSIQKLSEQIKGIEAAHGQLQSRIQENNEKFSAQQAQLQELQNRIFPSKIKEVTEDNDISPALKAVSPTMSPFSGAYLTLEDLEHFERRMVSLIINGHGGRAEVESIPVVLRRGIESFAGLELLLSNSSLFETNEGAMKNDKGEASKASSHGSSWRVIQKRWLAFKAFFPLNDNGYYTARRCLIQCAMDRSSQEFLITLNKRNEKVLLRLTGILRRVENMKDSEVLDVIM